MTFAADSPRHRCPFCRRPTSGGPRYPRAVCAECAERATDSAGRRVRGFNVSLSGGFEARHVGADGTSTDICDEVTRSGLCRVDGVLCEIGEAHFGGVVIEPHDPPPSGP